MTPRYSLALTLLATFSLTVPAACQCASRAGPGSSGTGGSSGGTSTTGGSTGTTSGNTTAPKPDVPSNCHPEQYGECDPWCQDCPEGQKCMPKGEPKTYTFTTTVCTPIAPAPKAPGQPCTAPGGQFGGTDDCQERAICWNVDSETNEGVCVATCGGTPDTPDCGTIDSYCYFQEGSVLLLCLPWCSPLTLSSCASEDTCVLAGPDLLMAAAAPPPYDPNEVDFKCLLRQGPLAPQATPCPLVNVCDPGLACVDATLVPNCDPDAAPGCCARWCDLAQPDCPEGGTCQPILQPDPDLPQEFADLGLCLLP